MSNEKILTISVAAYNVEEYIRQTLDSLTDERVIGNLEIFVVDDGGKDSTLDIAKEYANIYPESVFPIHKENGGYGSTVNYSLAHAHGKYFKLLDGDDWFDTENLIRIVEYLKSSSVDLIVTPYSSGKTAAEMSKKQIDWLNDGCVIKISDIIDAKPLPMWTLMVKTQILRNKWEPLPEKSFYTDVLMAMQSMAFSTDIVMKDMALYCYRLDREGNSTNKDALIKHYPQHMEIAKKCAMFYEQQKGLENPNLVMLCSRSAMTYISAFRGVIYDKPNIKTFKALKKYDKEYKKVSLDSYRETEKISSRVSFLLRILRRTGYMAYWMRFIVRV